MMMLMMNIDYDNSPVKVCSTPICMTAISPYCKSAAIKPTANHSDSHCVYITLLFTIIHICTHWL